MKAYTDIEQSKKLAEILPLESADMKWFVPADDEGEFIEEVSLINDKTEYYLFDGITDWDDTPYIPCWSLAALLGELDDEIIDEEGNDYNLTIVKESLQYQLYYHDAWGRAEDIETDYYDDMIDACYEMILKLNELNLL